MIYTRLRTLLVALLLVSFSVTALRAQEAPSSHRRHFRTKLAEDALFASVMLKYANASSAATHVETMFPELRLSVIRPANGIILAGDKDRIAKAQELLRLVDVKDNQNTETYTYRDDQFGTSSPSLARSRSPRERQLASQLAEAEKEIQRVTATRREYLATHSSDHAGVKRLRRQLSTAVAHAFVVELELQRHQLKQMNERAKRIEQRLQQREAAQAEHVEDRVKQLLSAPSFPEIPRKED